MQGMNFTCTKYENIFHFLMSTSGQWIYVQFVLITMLYIEQIYCYMYNEIYYHYKKMKLFHNYIKYFII